MDATLPRRRVLVLGGAATALLAGCGTGDAKAPAVAATPPAGAATPPTRATTTPAVVSTALARDVERFELGVASGQPRASSLVLWTRITGPALPDRVDVQWELGHDEGFRRIAARGSFTAESAWAHSVHAQVQGLEPARTYWYRFVALGQRSGVGRTRTAPADDADASLRLAIASCQRYDSGHYAAWRDLAARDLDAVLFLGDYIYETGSRERAVRRHRGGEVVTLEAYRDRYAQYKSDPLLQAAHAACPWWVVWDDHEVHNDYAGEQGQDLAPDFMTRRAAAYQAFWEHMPFTLPQRPRGPSMRIVDRFTWGRLATLHLLDDRQYRDAQACAGDGAGGSRTLRESACAALRDPRRTLLGREQERWLEQGWDLARPWNLVGQQTLVAPFGTGDDPRDFSRWTDGWDGYPAARERLLDGIAARKLGGAVILGGDVHTHYVTSLHREPDNTKSAVVASEFCGTSISTGSWPDARVKAAMVHNPHVHYGRSDKRGAIVLDVNAQRVQAQLLGVDDPLRADSAVQVLARYVVEAGRPGPVQA
jgi:alkaline phosphatase D